MASSYSRFGDFPSLFLKFRQYAAQFDLLIYAIHYLLSIASYSHLPEGQVTLFPTLMRLACGRHSVAVCWMGKCMNDCLYYPPIVQCLSWVVRFSFQVIYRLSSVLWERSLSLASAQPD